MLLLCVVMRAYTSKMKRYFEPYHLSVVQQAFLTTYFSLGAMFNPTRGDLVAGLGDVTSVNVIRRLHEHMVSDPVGKELLERKPLITVKSLDLPKLRILPAGTMGREYVRYMDTHGFSADERNIVRFMDNPDHAYTLVRYRQVHDFWHVLSGLPPTELGEIALKAFEYRVTGLPVCLLSTLFGPLRLKPSQVKVLYSKYIPWAIQAGGSCSNLMAFEYEHYLDTPVKIVQKALRFQPAPSMPRDY
jgi:ubiquinone biosynthesis protein COQ4